MGCGVLYLVFGVFGKFFVVFIFIFNFVLGGLLIIMMGMFIGVMFFNFRLVFLIFIWNFVIIGIFIMIGFIILEYIKKFGSDIDIGMVEICFLFIILV